MLSLLGPRQRPSRHVLTWPVFGEAGTQGQPSAILSCKDTDPVMPGLYPHDPFNFRYIHMHLVSSKPYCGWGAGERQRSVHSTGDAQISFLCLSVGFLLPQAPVHPPRGLPFGCPAGLLSTPCASLGLLSPDALDSLFLLHPWSLGSPSAQLPAPEAAASL